MIPMYKAMITRLTWNIWTLLSAVHRKAVKFNHSLTHSFVYIVVQWGLITKLFKFFEVTLPSNQIIWLL